MTIEEFIEYKQEAFSDVARLEAIGQTNMILVVSRDIFYAMVQFNNTALAYSNENGDVISRYNGFDLAIINENEAEHIMKPALFGMNHFVGMQIDDIIIVDDDNRLFRLERTNPVQYVDMGLTVRCRRHMATGDTALNMGTMYADNMVQQYVHFDTAPELTFDTTAYATYDTTGYATYTTADRAEPFYLRQPQTIEMTLDNVTIDWANIFNNFGTSMGEPKPDENELGVGDTKLIDDFLNGFSKKEILNPAT